MTLIFNWKIYSCNICIVYKNIHRENNCALLSTILFTSMITSVNKIRIKLFKNHSTFVKQTKFALISTNCIM